MARGGGFGILQTTECLLLHWRAGSFAQAKRGTFALCAASARPKRSGPKAGNGPERGILDFAMGWCSLLSRRAGFFCPGKRGYVCAPLPLPGVGEEAPRRGGRRGRFRPSRTSGAPGIGLSHRTHNVLQKQLDRLFSLAECASRGMELTFGRTGYVHRKPGKIL